MRNTHSYTLLRERGFTVNFNGTNNAIYVTACCGG